LDDFTLGNMTSDKCTKDAKTNEKVEISLLTFVWSLLEAARTIACDLMPLMDAGFRLQRTQTLRFCQMINIMSSLADWVA
jgi:hypothetical protein